MPVLKKVRVPFGCLPVSSSGRFYLDERYSELWLVVDQLKELASTKPGCPLAQYVTGFVPC